MSVNYWEVRKPNGEPIASGGYSAVPGNGYVSPIATPNINEAFLALAAITLGIEDETQRKEFYARARSLLLISNGLPASYLYDEIIRIGYEVKYGRA